MAKGTYGGDEFNNRMLQLCGAPNVMGANTPKSCPRCARLFESKVRKCLRCDRPFMPGCKSVFTCRVCYLTRPKEW